MARGSETIVSSNPKGEFIEGIVKAGQTFYPGMAVLIDASVALSQGRHTFKVFDESADGDHPGGPIVIVTNILNSCIGKTMSDGYAAGQRFSGYCPRSGEELNLRILDITGTGDDHDLGEKLMIDTGTGKFIISTGTPEEEVARLLEAITDPTADTIAWCIWGR